MGTCGSRCTAVTQQAALLFNVSGDDRPLSTDRLPIKLTIPVLVSNQTVHMTMQINYLQKHVDQ